MQMLHDHNLDRTEVHLSEQSHSRGTCRSELEAEKENIWEIIHFYRTNFLCCMKHKPAGAQCDPWWAQLSQRSHSVEFDSWTDSARSDQWWSVSCDRSDRMSSEADDGKFESSNCCCLSWNLKNSSNSLSSRDPSSLVFDWCRSDDRYAVNCRAAAIVQFAWCLADSLADSARLLSLLWWWWSWAIGLERQRALDYSDLSVALHAVKRRRQDSVPCVLYS